MLRTGDMTDNENRRTGPRLRSGPLFTGTGLMGAGALLALAGFAVAGLHVLAATRRWIRELDVPPGEVARLKWAQAKATAAAGADAWRNGHPARQPADS
jgi:hypothetical protein